MNKTEHYQLNQWEATDRILRENFNQDNLNVENALTALNTAITTETAAREQAVSAAKSEAATQLAAETSARTTALNSAVSQINTNKADKTALTSLTTTVNGLPFVRLKSITTSAAATQVNVSVSDIKLADYAYWLIIPVLSCNDLIHLRLNSISSGYTVANSSVAYLAAAYGVSKSYVWQAKLIAQSTSGGIHCISDDVSSQGKIDNTAGLLPSSKLTASALTAINFVSAGESIAAGGKITIYGVKY